MNLVKETNKSRHNVSRYRVLNNQGERNEVNPQRAKANKVSLKLCMLLLNTLDILLSAFFNVWSIYLAPIPNNGEHKSSSVAQNNSTFMYWKYNGKRSVLTYCCLHFHLNVCHRWTGGLFKYY